MTEELFPKWLNSDLIIYATPLFHHTVNATMKTFLERTFPICEPFLLEKDGRWIHPLRKKHPGVVVLSVCGFPAMSAFGALSHYVQFLSMGFNPEAAGDTKATLQFDFTGSVAGSCHFIIADGTIRAKQGKAEKADLIVHTPFNVWMDIVMDKADGAEMFMQGKYEVEGNTEFLDMRKFFRK